MTILNWIDMVYVLHLSLYTKNALLASLVLLLLSIYHQLPHKH